MKKQHPKREDLTPLRPVGLALAAVVAGLGAGQAAAEPARTTAPLEPPSEGKTFVLDHTNDPRFHEDPDMVVGRSTPVAPLANARAEED